MLTSVGPACAADFNGDGVVNDDDLGVWRSGLGAAVGHLANGDANRDGVVNGSDFLTWQRCLEGGSAVTAVPEPTGTPLTLLTVIGSLHVPRYALALPRWTPAHRSR